jgi:hypothetical protein
LQHLVDQADRVAEIAGPEPGRASDRVSASSEGTCSKSILDLNE